MRFDWYSATVHAEAEEVLATLVGPLGDLRDVQPGRGMHGYIRGAEVVRGDRKFASVWWGGNGDGVHVQATGEEAAETSQRLRDAYPEHAVTRVDVCEDYTAPGAWDVLSKLALDTADEFGIRVNMAGDWHRCRDGRTVYVGAPSSVARLRVYEKGIQLEQDPDWVRVELVTRPKGMDARARCATAAPAEFFGSSRWSVRLAERLGAGEIARMRCGTVYRDSDFERTMTAMLRQYGPTLKLLEQMHGSREAASAEVWSRLDKLDRSRLRKV